MDQPFQYSALVYDRWFEGHPVLFESELAAIRHVLPHFEKGLEIGVGTGRFAAALGIQFGLEPLDAFAEIARSRGIEVVNGFAENLPHDDGSFDLALMVTVDCFLDDLPNTFAEAYRILQPGGSLLVAFLDKNGAFAKMYMQSGKPAYQSAHFHGPEEIARWMSNAGFSDLRFAQTLLEDNSSEPEAPKAGYGQGSFVVVAGFKKG